VAPVVPLKPLLLLAWWPLVADSLDDGDALLRVLWTDPEAAHKVRRAPGRCDVHCLLTTAL